jgi:hypothetical protein
MRFHGRLFLQCGQDGWKMESKDAGVNPHGGDFPAANVRQERTFRQANPLGGFFWC